jgi:hypothetical protein
VGITKPANRACALPHGSRTTAAMLEMPLFAAQKSCHGQTETTRVLPSGRIPLPDKEIPLMYETA